MTPTRLEAGRAVVAAKQATNITWAELAGELDRSVVWTTSALLGQQELDPSQARAVGTLLGLDEHTVDGLLGPPVRGQAALDPTEPVPYRFQEALQVYGGALQELIREEFGDGIMSAIDFTLDFEREPDPDGDRVKLIWSGKFLPYKTW